MKEASIQLIQAAGCNLPWERPTARVRGAHRQLPNNAVSTVQPPPQVPRTNTSPTPRPGTQIRVPSDPDISDSPGLC